MLLKIEGTVAVATGPGRIFGIDQFHGDTLKGRWRSSQIGSKPTVLGALAATYVASIRAD